MADHPYAVLNAPWVDSMQREAADAFLGYLLTPPVQARFANAGFRDHAGLAGREISSENGLLASGPFVVLPPPAASILTRMQASWDDLRKRAHLLIAIDTSSAMGETLPGGGTKLELAKRAARPRSTSYRRMTRSVSGSSPRASRRTRRIASSRRSHRSRHAARRSARSSMG